MLRIKGGGRSPGQMPQFPRSALPRYYLGDHMKDTSQTSGSNGRNLNNGRFLGAREFAILSAACARLIPQPEREPFLGVAQAIDHRLAEETAGRWPNSGRFLDGEALRLGLRGLDDLSRARLRVDFTQLDPVRQHQILFSLQNGIAHTGVWHKLSPKHFFDELLQECTEIYHSAPVTEEAVNF